MSHALRIRQRPAAAEELMMFDDEWSERFADRVDQLLERVEHEDGVMRLGDAAAELRATSLVGSLDSVDNDDLARMIDEYVTMAEGFGVLGARDGQNTLIDPANATLSTGAAILYRRKFSHRITATDVTNRVLPLEGPLGMVDWDIVGNDKLSDSRGNLIDRFGPGGHNLAVPDWVDGFSEGRLMIVWREDDQVHFEVIDEGAIATNGATELQAIAERIQESTTDGVGVNLQLMIFEELCQVPSLFTPTTPPLDELLRANGYNNRGEWWGPTDRNWATPGEAARAARIALASETYGLDRQAQQALIRFNEIWQEWSAFHTFGIGELPQIDPDEIQDIMRVEKVPLAFFDMHEPQARLPVRAQPTGSKTALDLFVDEMNRADPDSIAAMLLAARSLELHGQVRRAEAGYRQVLRRDDTNGTALVKCLNAAVDASQFDEATRLIRRLSGPGSADEKILQSYANAMITAGRNESCPCGSGRKYKKCHQDLPLLSGPIATRALIFKLEMFAEQTVINQQYAPGGGSGAQAQLVGYPEARDFMIHEGGLLDRFLQDRAELLPPNELERLRSWQVGRRDLYEILGVDRGVGMDLRNLRTGNEQQIVEDRGSLDAQVGQLLLLRLETIEGLTAAYGQGVLVPTDHRDRVLEITEHLEIEDLLAWFVELLMDEAASD